MSLYELEISPVPSSSSAPSRPVNRQAPPPLHFYEAWETEAGALQTRSGILPQSEIDEWLRLEGHHRIDCEKRAIQDEDMILRLVACDYDQHPFAIGCGPRVFSRIKEAFALHETSEEAILNNNGAFARYFMSGKDPAKMDTFALVFKVANGLHIGYDALSLTYNMKSRTTRAFIHGYLDAETVRLTKYLDTLTERVQFEMPFLLPAHIYQGYRAKTEAYRVLVDDSLCQTEIQTSYAVPGMLLTEIQRRLPHSRRNFRQVQSRPEELDFEGITRRLHSISTELGTVLNAGNFGKELGTFLCKTAKEVESLLEMPSDEAKISHLALTQRIEFCTNMYTSLISQTSILRDRVLNHINLTFSLIAQDENRIARRVAEESAQVSIAAKRDSAAMKSISLLTMVFLPPTFVATFFSMTMFDWKPDDKSSEIASRYIWVYWVVTVPLTATVILIWRLWFNKENKSFEPVLPKILSERQASSTTSTDSEPPRFTNVHNHMGEYSEARKEQLKPARRTPFSVYGVADSPA